MELRITTRAVEVAVWDSDPTVPTARATNPERIDQHGLELVKVVTQDLSIQQLPVGKRVTASLPLLDPPGARATPRGSD
ncbi:ATP-binding protein [Streptomyces sp. NPDC127084]|uniref:ATP-binding protein n=1 Tax=Streptomyces sp. NPDC127084 TaxID=3347133 RepID=UPI003647DCFD